MRPGTTGISGGARPQTSLQKFRPRPEWKHEEDASFLLVYLPGFVVEQITITSDYSNRTLNFQGQRRLPDNRLLPLNETFSIPEDCDLTKMEKEFGRGIIMLKMPRNIVLPQLVPQPETTEETAKEESKTTPESSRSPEDEETDPLRETSAAGAKKQGTEKSGIVTPAISSVDGSVSAEAVFAKLRDEKSATAVTSRDEEKLAEKKEENNDETKPESATMNPVQKISGVKEEDSEEQNKESTMASKTATAKVEEMEEKSETAAAKVEQKEKTRKSADHSAHIKSKEAEMGNANVSAKQGLVKELNGDRKLMVNMGAAILIIVGVGVFYFIA